MNVYRLEPIDPGHARWRVSNEQDVVWACAPDPESARALVAGKTGIEAPEAEGPSPWEDEAVTSCALDPTISLLRAGDVVRQDGSVIDARAATLCGPL